MEKDFISQLENKNREKIKPILKDFIQMSSSLAYRYILYEDTNCYKLWRAVFAILRDDTLNEFHLLGVQTICILTRDYRNMIKPDVTNDYLFLCKFVHLTLSSNTTEEQQSVDAAEVVQPDMASFHAELVIETLNFIPDVTRYIFRGLFVHRGIVEALLERICSATVYPGGVMLAYINLLWYFTNGACALDRVKNNSNALTYMIEMLDGHGIETLDTDEQCAVLHKLVMIMFRVTGGPSKAFSELQYIRLTGVLRRLLLRFGAMKTRFEKNFMYSIIDLLAAISSTSRLQLVTKCEPAEAEASSDAQLLIFEGWNVRALEIMLRYLQSFLSPYSIDFIVSLTVPRLLRILTECARCHRIMRRYIRSVVLPPLRDVSNRFEEGFTLREYLCRLMTIREERSAADLLFVCCKENVSRMIKYTGYDKVPEIFAERDKSAEYSSDSEDSDNEEYNQVPHGINPVLSWMKIPELHYEQPVCCTMTYDSVYESS